MKKTALFLALLFFLESGFGFSKKASCSCRDQEFKEAFFGKFSLEQQNFAADLWKLERFENEAEIKKAIQDKKLVAVLPNAQNYFIDPRLDRKTYFIRPWVPGFMEQFANDFYGQTQLDKKAYRKKLEITGLVRDKKYQKNLARRNPNAVWDEKNPARQSSHLTGATFDITTRGLSRDEICWIKGYLLELQNLHLIHVRDEFYNNCLHVMVFPMPTFAPDFGK